MSLARAVSREWTGWSADAGASGTTAAAQRGQGAIGGGGNRSPWDNRKHEALFSSAMREKHFSVYGMAFMMAVELNRASAAREGYSADIDYVLDDGNRFKQHIIQMYDSIRRMPELAEYRVGSLDFDTDANV